MADALQAGQYIASDKDNVAVDPQPGDVEITDIYGNVFDNFNEYGAVTGADKDTAKNRLVAFYNKDNVLLNPQPAYQNLNFVATDKDNVDKDPQPLPDAKDYVFSGVIPGTTRTPEPYVKSPLWPDGPPAWYDPIVGDGKQLRTIEVVLNAEDSEALIVTEDDVSEIKLELSITQIRNIPSIAKFG